MKFGLVPRLLLTCMAISHVSAVPHIYTLQQAMAFLNKYGYLQAAEMEGGMPKTDEIMRKAIQYFQVFANIEMTGAMNNETYGMMNQPRCGMPDMDDTEMDMARKKRYAARSMWPKTDLTYRIDSRTPDLSPTDVDRIMKEALQVWSDHSALTFEERSGQAADILINFYENERHTSNVYDEVFDGPGGVLAHAFFPTTSFAYDIGGDAHFDDAEDFTDGKISGINLFQVAAHEFGHSLGLGHSQVQGALMYPYYRGYEENFKLHSDDIAGIQVLYGDGSGNPEVKPSTPVTPVDNCMTSISFATSTDDGNYYLGNATHVFRLYNDYLITGYPKRIGEEFPGLPEDLDAGFYNPNDGKTYMFKGNQFWRLTNQEIDPSYPQDISSSQEFSNLPGDLDAAFVWSGNGRIYITKGDQYYRIKVGGTSNTLLGVDDRYPRSLSVWNGLPDKVNAAFQYDNDQTYFFSDLDYYRFNDFRFQTGSSYPRNTAVWWLACDATAVGLEVDDSAGNVIIPSATTLLISFLIAVFSASKLF